MTARSKWISALLGSVTLLGVVACSKPGLTISADAQDPGGKPAETLARKGEQTPKPTETGKPEQLPVAPVKEPADDKVGTKQGGEGAKAEPTGTAFEFPGDQGGQLLRRLLTPRDLSTSAQPQVAPLRRKPLARIEDPSPGLPLVNPTPPRVSMYGPTTPLRPIFIVPEHMLGNTDLSLALPEVQTMPTGPLLKLAADDVNKPISLAPIAVPLSNKEPYTDPSRASSAEAAIKATMPVRATAVPFTPETYPDPFENEAAVRKLAPPEEEILPLSSGSSAPKK